MFIDPAQCQLLFVHLQPALVARSATERPETIKAAATALAKMAQLLDMPITFGLVPEESGAAAPIAPLLPFADAANSFVRHAATVFLDSALAARLNAQQRPVLLLGGFATEVVVLLSALDAIDAGYAVHVPIDLIGGLAIRSERAALDRITAAGGTVTSVATLLAMLAPDFATPEGQTVMALQAGLGGD